MSARALIAWCLAAALAAIVFVGVSGARWPLAFIATMVTISFIIAVGEAILGRDRED